MKVELILQVVRKLRGASPWTAGGLNPQRLMKVIGCGVRQSHVSKSIVTEDMHDNTDYVTVQYYC